MPRFVSATYHPDIQTAQFIADDGRCCLRSGGSLPWRLNNGGDLLSPLDADKKPCPKKTKGFLAVVQAGAYDDHWFFVFPDYETGRRELKASLKRKYMTGNMTDFVNKFAPGKDHNNVAKYVSQLSTYSGISADTKFSDLSDADLNKLMDGIEQIEGYNKDEATRKETWVVVSTIHATDGKVPVAGEEIVLRGDGKETTLKSNASGQFPPIVHAKGPMQVFHKTPDGSEKKVGDLPPDQGQHFSLLTKFSEFVGWNAPVKAPESPSPKKQHFQYTVQPNDSLSKIAAHFKISVDQIKQDNHLTSNKILAGQVLGINGPAPAQLAPTPPKKAPPKPKPKDAAVPDAKPAPKPKPPPESQTKAARSKDGSGETLALIEPEEGVAPWMKHALNEAKRFHGRPEWEIETEINYHKEIKDGQTSMTGSAHAWCAAFVNWCLAQAGYPIRNLKENGFIDISGEIGRANQFINTKTKDGRVANPLYAEIDEPVYGVIGVETNSSGHGQHVGFVYGKQGKEICLLGGNQHDRIKFSCFSSSTHFKFFIPVSYQEFFKKNKGTLPDVNGNSLNLTIGIDEKPRKKGQAESTT
jgi:uncharacterized protein (TIGR02594 family)